MSGKNRKWNAASFSLEVRLQAASARRPPVQQEGVPGLRVIERVLAVCAGTSIFWQEIAHVKGLKKLCCVNKTTQVLLAPTPDSFPFCHLYSQAFSLHSWRECYDWYHWRKNHLKEVAATDTAPAPLRGGHKKAMFKLSDVLDYLVRRSGSFEAYVARLARYRKNRAVHFKRQVAFLRKNHPDDAVPAQLVRAHSSA